MLLTAPSPRVAPALRRVGGAVDGLRRRVAGPAGRFRTWRRRRPFVGGVLTVLAGLEMFFSGQLDLGNIHVQMGISGFQATIIPAMLVLMGVLAIATPAQRLFYGILTLVIAVYSLVGVNLGGFFVGMLLASIGGVAIVTWRPRTAAGPGGARAESTGAPVAGGSTTPDVAPRPATLAGAPAPAPATDGRVHAEWVDTRHLRDASPRARGAAEPPALAKGRA